MESQQRTSRACKGKGGKWVRFPRPLPHKQMTVDENGGPSDATEEFYDSCDVAGEMALSEALVAGTEPVVHMLRQMGEEEAAVAVQALCVQLDQREGTHQKLKTKYKEVKHKLSETEEKSTANANFRGHSARWWRKSQRQERQLSELRMRQWQSSPKQTWQPHPPN